MSNRGSSQKMAGNPRSYSGYENVAGPSTISRCSNACRNPRSTAASDSPHSARTFSMAQWNSGRYMWYARGLGVSLMRTAPTSQGMPPRHLRPRHVKCTLFGCRITSGDWNPNSSAIGVPHRRIWPASWRATPSSKRHGTGWDASAIRTPSVAEQGVARIQAVYFRLRFLPIRERSGLISFAQTNLSLILNSKLHPRKEILSCSCRQPSLACPLRRSSSRPIDLDNGDRALDCACARPTHRLRIIADVRDAERRRGHSHAEHGNEKKQGPFQRFKVAGLVSCTGA